MNEIASLQDAWRLLPFRTLRSRCARNDKRSSRDYEIAPLQDAAQSLRSQWQKRWWDCFLSGRCAVATLAMTDFFVIARMSHRDDEAISGCRFDDVLCWLGMMRLLPFRTLGDCFLSGRLEIASLRSQWQNGVWDCFLSGRCAVAALAM